jgi:predicted amidohydrolase
MLNKVKIAAAQINPKLMANRENLDKILQYIRLAARQDAKLIAFPECSLSGYVFTSCKEALPYMETIPGPATSSIVSVCKETKTYVVVGLLEIDGLKCYNTAVLLGPEGLIGKYRKIHLPFLGIDRYLDHGDQPFQVYQTPVGNIGMFICYDCTFPESAREMTLKGADILVLPTNWPAGREKVPALILPTRAYENRVYIMGADRVGTERGASFLGLSKIVDTLGDTLAQGSPDKEEIIYAEINPQTARQKRLVFIPGEFEMDFIADRHPELYGELTKSKPAT